MIIILSQYYICQWENLLPHNKKTGFGCKQSVREGYKSLVFLCGSGCNRNEETDKKRGMR